MCAGVASAAANWQRWIDPFVDSAREMIVPARLADGERLYRDVVYHYGPAAPWINAVVIRIFGRRFAALEAVGLLASILLFCSLARLTARAGSRLSAFLAATWGAAVCLGAPAGGSFLFPYSFGTLIALAAAFLCLDQASDARGARSDGLAAGGLALALAAKPEIGAACVLLLLLWLLRSEERRRLSRQTFRIVGGGLGGAAVAYGIAFAGISLASLSPEGPLALFAPPREWRNVYRLLAGLGDPARAIRATGTALFCGVVLIVLAALAANIAVRAPRAALFIWTLLIGGLTLFFSLPIGGAIDDRLPPLLEPMPLFALGAGLFFLFAPNQEGRGRACFLLFGFAGAFGSRVLFGLAYGATTTPYSVLAFPGLAAAAAVLLLDLASRRFAARPALAVAWRSRLAILMVGLSVAGVARWHRLLPSDRHLTVQTASGFLSLPAGRALAVRDTLEFLAREARPGDGLSGFPEGGFFNFVTRLSNPLREDQILPGHLTADDERRVAERLESHGPRFVLVANLSTAPFGPSWFGVDYARDIQRVIDQRYRAAATFGPAPPDAPIGAPDFFVRVFLRRP